mmetsp:Transcript_25152/g.73490  ORF Transcript_25152/g.73490 Transcript_25152/m.73490 type:complete len:209 (-) Transcript_25152:581-1207(-)
MRLSSSLSAFPSQKYTDCTDGTMFTQAASFFDTIVEARVLASSAGAVIHTTAYSSPATARSEPSNAPWRTGVCAFHPFSSTTWDTPGNAGSWSWNSCWILGGTKRPPRKCLPWKCTADFLGAVRETSTSGCSPSPEGSPPSTCHPEGISTERTGSAPLRAFNADKISSKGARGAPRKEKPKIASTAASNLSRSTSSREVCTGIARSVH